MTNQSPFACHARRVTVTVAAVFAAIFIFSQTTQAASWNGIEPLKSRRADVERILGRPLPQESGGQQNTLRFKVAGGLVTVFFTDARFVKNKKLPADLEGTVLEVVLQHENSSDTPESLGLPQKHEFKRDDQHGAIIYSNLRDGIVYTFINNRLKTTRYSPSTRELSRTQR
ncbi:MAG: hypothetical protein AUG51_07030 [Acidobacteria bacterium 13_1_20CM_3_53_8]|nr:MAG: hypothetical protein AUG51_07030 [Acidobacteria bacterium 13_1_20CM_3_53_8]